MTIIGNEASLGNGERASANGGDASAWRTKSRQYRLEDTVPAPAKAGDVVCFNIFTAPGAVDREGLAVVYCRRWRRVGREGLRDR